MIAQIDGVLRTMRSERSDCSCCDGPHIFAFGVEIEKGPSKVYPGLAVESISDWIHEQLSPWRDRDGMKVRVSLEFAADNEVKPT